MQDKTSPRIRKLTQNLSFVQYDKNLLQSNGQSRNREIPIDGYFAYDTSPHIRTEASSRITIPPPVLFEHRQRQHLGADDGEPDAINTE